MRTMQTRIGVKEIAGKIKNKSIGDFNLFGATSDRSDYSDVNPSQFFFSSLSYSLVIKNLAGIKLEVHLTVILTYRPDENESNVNNLRNNPPNQNMAAEFTPLRDMGKRSNFYLFNGEVFILRHRRKRLTSMSSQTIEKVYEIEGLGMAELPVIGFDVHPRIIPGFSYRVRPMLQSKYLFSGKALRLMSVGMGYGKRLTFAPNNDERNYNDNYFWSDSRPEGFGLELEVVSPGDQLSIIDSRDRTIANCEVLGNCEPQREESHMVISDGTVEKWVMVKLLCRVLPEEGAILEGQINGTAISSKPAGSKTAGLVRIMDCTSTILGLRDLGTFTLMPGTDMHIQPVIVCGGSKKDIPIKYAISGLLGHEFPVIGTYVDDRILPGFHYMVRRAHSKSYFFQAQPLRLLSIGKGYAKRFTFDSELKSYNENYFWSDSYTEGFRFTPFEVFKNQKFKIIIGGVEIGTAIVERAVQPQVEIEMKILDKNAVMKRLRVDIVCSIQIYDKPLARDCRVFGTASVVRQNNDTFASVKQIEGIGLDSALYKTLQAVSGEMIFYS